MKIISIAISILFVSNIALCQTHSVKKIEFDKTISSFVEGESEKSWVKFEDGTTGYLFYSKKYQEYYISNGTSDFAYKSKDYAIDALWEYKKNGKITSTGKK
jgi:hypothetical protein